MCRDTSLTIIVPIYNENKLLDARFSDIETFLEKNLLDFEVIFVESGSTDGTDVECDKLALKYPRVRVIHEGARNGFGSAVKIGHRNATKEMVLVLTVDVPYPLQAIVNALIFAKSYDCILSYRMNDRRSLFRRVQSVVFNILVKGMLQLQFKQVNSAFKMIRRERLKEFDLLSNGWLIDAELLFEISRRKISCIEVPIELVERTVGTSSVSPFAFIGVLKELRRLVKRKETS
jgi:glycosyltransferase involved in cell wall biosynthesis